MTIKSICVYCGSQPGKDPAFVESANILGKAMANAGITLVYGGGDRGIMGAVSKAVRDNGGTIQGIIPEFLLSKEANYEMSVSNEEIVIVESMHERKQKMFELSDAFIALPGGIGTLEEIVEIMTWAQLDRHSKPMCFLNVQGFWNPMLELFNHMNEAGFIHTAEKVMPIVIEDANNAIATINQASA